tara:strand:- start:4894 stop:5472 length:579 start_codon:yes stop_codon:yes gene_type:complete
LTVLKSFFFVYRSYTPVPIVMALLYFSDIKILYFSIGLILIFLGEILRIYAVSYAGGKTRTRNVGASTLCTAGPYSRTRNPLYVGNVIIYLGVVFFSGGPLMWQFLFIVLVFFCIQYYFIIQLEEKKLLELFKDKYVNYQNNVPALVPRITPWTGGVKIAPHTLSQTLKIEKRTLQNIALIIIFIIVKSILI